ncbi:hypothetical protein [Photorhabdus luminescens]|uniref:hypothetical protein n=1 Tax=Photorhabdus luminescens TaxID=29488 RepID=UPI00104D7EA3|nr:hypothetical protein [Photorhabdus luminescens]
MFFVLLIFSVFHFLYQMPYSCAWFCTWNIKSHCTLSKEVLLARQAIGLPDPADTEAISDG